MVEGWAPDTETLGLTSLPQAGWEGGLGLFPPGPGLMAVPVEVGAEASICAFTQNPQQSNSGPSSAPGAWGFLPWEEGALWPESWPFKKLRRQGSRSAVPLACSMTLSKVTTPI